MRTSAGTALASVVEDPLSKVFVVLYAITREDEKNLDLWEGSELGIHKKIRCRVDRVSSDTSTDPVLAWLYALDAWEGGVPSARYLGVMAPRDSRSPTGIRARPAHPPRPQYRPGHVRGCPLLPRACTATRHFAHGHSASVRVVSPDGVRPWWCWHTT